MESISWNLIDKYFKNNPYNLVAHHLDSYNSFFETGIFNIFKENNPIRFIERENADDPTGEKRNESKLYLGGKDGNKIYFGKPEAEYYIDDLAISSYVDLEKELGYYNSNIANYI